MASRTQTTTSFTNATSTPNMATREQQLSQREANMANREEMANERDWELDLREEGIDDAAYDVQEREDNVIAQERRLAQLVSSWTGAPIPADVSAEEFLERFDWTAMPMPPGFNRGGMPQAPPAPPRTQAEPLVPVQYQNAHIQFADPFALPGIAQSIEREPTPEMPDTPTPAGRLAIPNMQARIRKQPAKRKRSTNDDEAEGDNKKAKIVIDLTADD